MRTRLLADTAVTAAAQFAAMAIGGVLAVVIVHAFGKGEQTDGLFAAYGLYAVAVLVAGSTRVALVGRLAGGPEQELDHYLAAVAALGAVLIVGGILLGDPVGKLLVGADRPRASHTAAQAMAVLGPAAAAQLLAALAASGLATRGSFKPVAVGYVAGGLLSLALLVGLKHALGIRAVSVGILAGSLLTAAIALGALGRAGYRPAPRRLRPDAVAARALFTIGLGAIGSALWQVAYVVSTAGAARIASGAVTDYAYAFFAASLLIGVSSGSAAVVIAAPVARSWTGEAASVAGPLRGLVRASTTLAAPALAVGAVLGTEIVHRVLGGSFSGADARAIVASVLALSGVIVGASLLPVPALAAFADGRYRVVAFASAVAFALQVALTALATAGDRVWLVGLAASCGSLATGMLLVRGALGPGGLPILAGALADSLRLALLTVVAFAPLGLLAAAAGGLGVRLAAAAAGLVLWTAGLRLLLPAHWALLGRLRPAGLSRA